MLTNPPPLMYYKDWTAATPLDLRTTSKLLSTGQGNCQAWTAFFIDVLMAQGITFEKPVYDIAPKNQRDETMYVKNWQAPTNSNTGADSQKLGYLYFNTSSLPLAWSQDPTTKTWGYSWTQEAVKKLTGAAGQGNANPVASFANHEVAQVTLDDGKKTILFDPSYGTPPYEGATDEQRLLAFQKGAIDFFGRTIHPAANLYIMEFKPASTTDLQLVSEAKKYGGTK